MTLAEADLAPSALLKEAAGVASLGDGQALPAVRYEEHVAPIATVGFVKVLKFVVGLFNPWDDDEAQDQGWWEHQPNREVAETARRAARFLRRRLRPS
jgi:hypothetical protein